MRQLPPLNSLKAFEAAARHGSFKKAAGELHVSHPAISRQVALLEDWLGIQLFKRLNRQVLLTQQGRDLFSEVSDALDKIALSARTIKQQQERSVELLVNAPLAFTMRWLIPRLPMFLSQHRNIKIKLTTSAGLVNFVHGPYDIAIRKRQHEVKGAEYRVFLPGLRLPVCSPELIEKKKLESLPDICAHTIIHADLSPKAWSEWLIAAGYRGPAPSSEISLETMTHVVQATIHGLGIALLPAALVTDEVAAGQLVFPFMHADTRLGDYRLFWKAQSHRKQIAVKAFCDWIGEEGSASARVINELTCNRVNVSESVAA